MKTEVKKSVKVARAIALIIIAGVVLLVALTPSDDKPVKKSPESVAKPVHAWFAAQEFVKAKLVSPATADFPAVDDRHDQYNDTTFWIEGHVDSQNGYGAMVRTSFQIKVVFVGGDPISPSNWRELEFREI